MHTLVTKHTVMLFSWQIPMSLVHCSNPVIYKNIERTSVTVEGKKKYSYPFGVSGANRDLQ